jgi:flavin reductase (DIM6/NTAB) family NADH-FMN oxidoreductase RutF
MISISIRPHRHSYALVKNSGEFVVNIPSLALLEKTDKAGIISGRDVDKFATLALTPVKAQRVAAPLIAECYANLECRVVDASMVTKYNFFILEVLKAWIDPSKKRPRTIHHLGRGAFMVAGRTIKLRSAMK